MKVSFVVEGKPRGKGRPRFAKRGAFVTTYTDEKTCEYEDKIRNAAIIAMNGRKASSEPLSLIIGVHVAIPKGWSKKKKYEAATHVLRPVTKPDLDNYIKTIDALNGICWGDDSQIYRIYAEKWYSENPRIEFFITDEEATSEH